MTTKDIKTILSYEWQGKRSYQAKYDTQCYECGMAIEFGDTLYFYHDKSKMCQECFEEVQAWLYEK